MRTFHNDFVIERGSSMCLLYDTSVGLLWEIDQSKHFQDDLC